MSVIKFFPTFEKVIAYYNLLLQLPGTGLLYGKIIFLNIQIFYMKHTFIRKFLMPFQSGPACVIAEGCDEPSFPQATNQCVCEVAVGGINELYFIPCTETFSEANVTNVEWWSDLVGTVEAPGVLGRSGIGLGSIAKLGQQTQRVGSCRTEQLISITWGLTFQIFCFDKSSARSTCAKMNELILRFNKYLLVARMCDGDNTILPVGNFNTSDFDWTVPDNNEESQSAQVVLSWKELGFPCTIDVPGLAAVLPKLS